MPRVSLYIVQPPLAITGFFTIHPKTQPSLSVPFRISYTLRLYCLTPSFCRYWGTELALLKVSLWAQCLCDVKFCAHFPPDAHAGYVQEQRSVSLTQFGFYLWWEESVDRASVDFGLATDDGVV